VRFALSRAGFETVEAADGAAGLALARSAAPDLIVLDVMLPEMEGTDVCRAIRADGVACPSSSSPRATTRWIGSWGWRSGRTTT
jgi:DNA-binding response OmpR family regulator